MGLVDTLREVKEDVHTSRVQSGRIIDSARAAARRGEDNITISSPVKPTADSMEKLHEEGFTVDISGKESDYTIKVSGW